MLENVREGFLMITFDLDKAVMAKAEDKAYNDYLMGKLKKNPYISGSLQYVAYENEWERLDYAESQQLAHQLEQWGI